MSTRWSGHADDINDAIRHKTIAAKLRETLVSVTRSDLNTFIAAKMSVLARYCKESSAKEKNPTRRNPHRADLTNPSLADHRDCCKHSSKRLTVNAIRTDRGQEPIPHPEYDAGEYEGASHTRRSRTKRRTPSPKSSRSKGSHGRELASHPASARWRFFYGLLPSCPPPQRPITLKFPWYNVCACMPP